MLESLLCLATCATLSLPITAAADRPFFLEGGETIVFFGDSITEAGTYVAYIETFLLARFPDKRFRVVNRGVSSETISGTSEPDHDPRRPWALDRFTRDVASEKPDVIVCCFGMNDGNYHPFDQERFERFMEGIRRLIDRTRKETHARLVILTPPPFDPYTRSVLDPHAKSYGYKFAAINYDDTLEQYSRWLTNLKEKDVLVVDLHSAMNEHLRKRRATQVSFSLQHDGIHPDETGHWLMAQTLLLAWQAPGVAADVQIDAGRDKASSGQVRSLHRDGAALSFEWLCPLAMPIELKWDAESIRMEDVRGRLNRYRLTLKGLPDGQYRLTADDEVFATASDDQLARGIDLLEHMEFPVHRMAVGLLELVRQREDCSCAAWRRSVGKRASTKDDSLNKAAVEDLKQQAAEIDRQIEALRQPRSIRVRIEPVNSTTRPM